MAIKTYNFKPVVLSLYIGKEITDHYFANRESAEDFLTDWEDIINGRKSKKSRKPDYHFKEGEDYEIIDIVVYKTSSEAITDIFAV